MNSETILIFKAEFNSDKKILSEIESIFDKIKLKIPIGNDKLHNIIVATTEAVINAIQHGNKFDQSKKVKLRVSASSENIQVIVQDKGTGFDPSTIEDPRSPENLLKERGRGIFLIRQLSDSVNITTSTKGTIVEMNFYLKNG